VLDRDEEFQRKVIGLIRGTKVALKITVTGNMVNIFAGEKQIATMNTALFYQLSVDEIIDRIGVPKNDRRKL
jgi:hypothetical protein